MNGRGINQHSHSLLKKNLRSSLLDMKSKPLYCNYQWKSNGPQCISKVIFNTLSPQHTQNHITQTEKRKQRCEVRWGTGTVHATKRRWPDRLVFADVTTGQESCSSESLAQEQQQQLDDDDTAWWLTGSRELDGGLDGLWFRNGAVWGQGSSSVLIWTLLSVDVMRFVIWG